MGTDAAGPGLRAQFDHVLVDEYQDTNTLQAEDWLRPGGHGLTVVGDDAQAIDGDGAGTSSTARHPRSDGVVRTT